MHHDALEFPDGQIVLLTRLCEGQHATVLQLPASPRATNEVEQQKRGSCYVIGLLAIELAWLSERLKSAIGAPMALPLPARQQNRTAEEGTLAL